MQQTAANSSFFIVFLVIELVILAVYLVAFWKIFTKAGRPGWAILIPFYNAYVLLKISGKPGWWLILYLIPLVNLVISILASIGLARNFGRSDTFGVVMLWLFGAIGYLMLGYGNSKYMSSSTLPVVNSAPQLQPAPVQQ